MTLPQAQDLLKSLSPEKGQAQQFRLLTPGVDTYRFGDEWLLGDFTWSGVGPNSYGKILDTNFNPIVRRAESLHIPDLKEKVKAAMLAAMESVDRVYQADGSVEENDFDEACRVEAAFRALCAPEVKP